MEFNQKILRFNNINTNKIIVKKWRKSFGRTLIFTINTDHANKLAQTFLKYHGDKIRIQVLHSNEISTTYRNKLVVKPSEIKEDSSGRMYRVFNPLDRRNIHKKFNEGEIDILISVNMYLMGIDIPQIKTLFIARPTLSPIVYIQMVGRGRRGPAFGGTSEINVVDFTAQVKSLTKLKAMHYSLFKNIEDGAEDYPEELCKDRYRSIRKPTQQQIGKPYRPRKRLDKNKRKGKKTDNERKLLEFFKKNGWKKLIRNVRNTKAKEIRTRFEKNISKSDSEHIKELYKYDGWMGLVDEYGITLAKIYKDWIERNIPKKKGTYYCGICDETHRNNSKIGRRHRIEI